MIGEPSEVGAAYVDLNFEGGVEGSPEGPRQGDGTADIAECWWEGADGQRQTVLRQGEPCTFHACVRFARDVEDPAIAVLFENEAHQPLVATSTEWADEETGRFRAGDEVRFSVSLEMAFAPGRIFASPWVVYRGGGRVMDRRPQMNSVVVSGSHLSGGLVDLPHEVRLESASGVLTGSPRT